MKIQEIHKLIKASTQVRVQLSLLLQMEQEGSSWLAGGRTLYILDTCKGAANYDKKDLTNAAAANSNLLKLLVARKLLTLFRLLSWRLLISHLHPAYWITI